MLVNKWFLVVIAAVAGQFVFAEEVKVLKVLRPLVVSLDRRPEKNIKYSKCIAAFKTEKGLVLRAAVAVQGDRVCPAADGLVLDSRDDKTITDSGNTETFSFELNDDEFHKGYLYKGKTWKLMYGHHPEKVVAKIKEEGNSSRIIEDSFFVTSVWDESSDEKMLIVSDKAKTITDIFETMHKTEKPLAIGKAEGSTVHAAGGEGDHKAVETKIVEVAKPK